MTIIYEILKIALGSFLGFLLGLRADRMILRQSDAERRKQLRSGLKTSIDHNNTLLGELSQWVESPGGTPHFNMDVTLLEATSVLKYELLNDVKLCEDIDRLRYELIHLSRKVDTLFNLRFDPIFLTQTHGENGKRLNEAHTLLSKSIKKHLGEIIPTIEPLITSLG